MHLEILVEDQSGAKALDILVPKIIGNNATHRIHPYKGLGHLPPDLKPKTDPQKRILLDQMPAILRGYAKTYTEAAPYAVVIVCDLDTKNFAVFLEELRACAEQVGASQIAHFCIAIEEGEAWLLGDIPAILSAYPEASRSVLNSYANDSICGTWETLADAVFPGGLRRIKSGNVNAGALKCEWAEQICPHMDVTRNQSPSFRHFRDTITALSD